MSEKTWKKRAQTGVLVIFGIAGLIFVFVLGLWVYVSATATPLHPNAQDVPSVTSSAPSPKWSDAVERGRQIVRTGVAEQNLPGVSIAVGSGGEIVWAEGFGYADLDKKTKVAPATQFRIGTASIALTSAALGLLLESGRLHLDDDIQAYVPAYPKKPWPVTLRQLMGHVAGVRNDGGDEGELLGQRCDRPVEGLKAFADGKLLFEPGTRYSFSRYDWIVVSAAVEAAAKEPFGRFVRTQVFEPLGMADTKTDSDPDPTVGRATSYFPRFAADPRYGPDVMRPVDYSCYAGSSAFLSTPTDLVRFAMAINRGKLLKPETVQLLQAPQRLSSGAETGYGLGWDIETATIGGTQTRLVGHDGDLLGGMVSSLITLPITLNDQGIVVSVISNTSYADTYLLAVKIADAFAKTKG